MSVRSIGEKTQDMARAGAREVSNRSSDASKTLSNKASEFADTANDTLKSYGIDTRDLGDTAIATLEEWQDALLASVKAHPLRSIAIAAAAGFVIARIGRR